MPFGRGRVKNIVIVVLLILCSVTVVSFFDTIYPFFGPVRELLSPIANKITAIQESTQDISKAINSYMGEVQDGDTRVVILFADESTYQVDAELALSKERQARGLMYRSSLCEYCGMLFVYDSDTTTGFWMKNCEIPLDIIFISKGGVIVDIKEHFQPCSNDPCPTYEPITSYRYVLEVPGGWCKEKGIRIGHTVTIPSIQ